MVSRPDESVPGGLNPDEGDIPSEDIRDVPEPLEASDLPDSGDLVDPDDE
jgi:hypothetical protein